MTQKFNQEKLLKLLVDKYRLRPNLISVLKVLMSGKKYTYLELSREANVPKTKIYELVNELHQMALINLLQESKGSTVYYMEDVRKNLLDFLNRQIEGSIEKYEETVDILEEEENVEEKTLLSSANHYVFGAIRIISGSDNIYALSRRSSAPPVFHPIRRDEYYKLRHTIAKSRETLTGTKGLTRMMYEEIIKAIAAGKHFTYIMTSQGLSFFLDKYKECFGQERRSEFVRELPERLSKSNHKVFVIDETNPLTMYASENRMALVITESRGEIAGIQTNQKPIVDMYLKMFREMLERSKPLDHYLDRLII